MTTTRDQLRRLPELAAEAFLTWDAPNPGSRTDRVKRGRTQAPPPTDLTALTALRTDDKGLLWTLSECVRIVWQAMDAEAMEDHPNPLDWSEATWSSECHLLLASFDWWQANLDAADLGWVEGAITKATKALVALTRQPKPNTLHCLVEGCRGSITPLVVDDAEGGQKLVADACEFGHRVDRQEAVRRALRLQDLPLTELAQHVGVPDKTLYRWAKRGLIHPIRHARGIALYNFEAVHRVALRMRGGGVA